jgi:hypothetical protein
LVKEKSLSKVFCLEFGAWDLVFFFPGHLLAQGRAPYPPDGTPYFERSFVKSWPLIDAGTIDPVSG